jgi:hypothetical protein
MARYINDSVHNPQVYKTVQFDTGNEIRILEKKEKLMKESRYSVKSYLQLIKGKDIK